MPIRPPSLRAIAAFEAAARHQSFAKAASELNLTTSAVSHSIKGLEKRLQRSLFARTGRKVELTEEGQSLAIRIRLSLNLLEQSFEVAPWVRRDRLVVSALQSVADRILLPALGTWLADHPGVALEIRCSSALADLDTHQTDVAIRFGPGNWAGMQSRYLAPERLFPVASPEYRGGNLPRTLDALRSCALIAHSEGMWGLWLEPRGVRFEDFTSILALDDSALMVEAAAHGYGVALARGTLVGRDLESGRLVRLFAEDVAAEYEHWAVWSASSPRLGLILEFVDWTERAFAA